MALIGDSHAQHLAFGVRERFVETAENPIALVSGGCYPVMTGGREHGDFMQCSQDFIDKAFTYVLESDEIEKVILSGYGVWELLRRRAHEPELLEPSEIKTRQAMLLAGMQETVGRLLASGKKVLLIADNPELMGNPAHCSTKTADWFGKCPLRLARRDVDLSLKEMDQIIQDLQSVHPTLEVFDPRSVFCDEDFCYSGTPEESWYRDYDHVTPAGSIRIINAALQGFE